MSNMTMINTRLGRVQGFRQGNANMFLGVRYGEPPVGPRRFLPATMTDGWSGTHDATQYGDRAMQNPGTLIDRQQVADQMSEDCLNLNIAAPAMAQTSPPTHTYRPVLLWIHGGGFVGGSANEYDASVLAQQGNMVIVTVNYRLGTLGLLDLSAHGTQYQGSSSNTVRDLVLALQWIQDNIHDYGGCSDNVTIAGESSGATLVLTLLATPSADGLYHKAIANSPTCAYMRATDPTPKWAAKLNIERSAFADTLLAMSAQEIIDLGWRYRVDVDGTVVTRTTYEAITDRGANGVPLLIGSNLNEGTLYTQGRDDPQEHYPHLNASLVQEMLCGGDPTHYLNRLKETCPQATPGKIHEMIWTDMFRRTATTAAALASQAGVGGWLYRFDLPANLPGFERYGATHSCEIPFTFNTFDNPSTQAHTFHDRNSPSVRDIALKWSTLVINFCSHGVPRADGVPDWPRYESDGRRCLVVGDHFEVVSDPDRLHRSMWNG